MEMQVSRISKEQLSVGVANCARALSSVFWKKSGSLQSYLDFLLCEVDPMLSQKRMAAEVVRIESETYETKTIVLRPSLRWKGFKAGQYVLVDFDIEGVRYRRNYSLSCSPKYYEDTGTVSITVKSVDKGNVSSFINRSLGVADVVHISEAMGQFILPESINAEIAFEPVFIAGGSGITPIRSMIDALILANERSGGLPPKITLVHHAKNASDIILQEHFEQLSNQHEQFRYIKHFSDFEGNISLDQLKQDCPRLKQNSIFMCGPQGFMQAVKNIAQSLSVPKANIYSESFGGAQVPKIEGEAAEPGKIEFAFANKYAQSDGSSSLLELAESAGLTPKYGCRSGVCHECKCERPQGQLVNRQTGQWIPEDQTHIQACISVPSGNLTLKQW